MITCEYCDKPIIDGDCTSDCNYRNEQIEKLQAENSELLHLIDGYKLVSAAYDSAIALNLKLEKELAEAREVIEQLVKVAIKSSPSDMGGSPDLFYPKWEERIGDPDPWDIHDEEVFNRVEKARAFLEKTK